MVRSRRAELIKNLNELGPLRPPVELFGGAQGVRLEFGVASPIGKNPTNRMRDRLRLRRVTRRAEVISLHDPRELWIVARHYRQSGIIDSKSFVGRQ